MSFAANAVTENIIAALQNGTVPWRRPWTVLAPTNRLTGKQYTGVNTLLLCEGGEWLTFKQALALKGCVKKGAKSRKVVFYKQTQYTRQEEDGTEYLKAGMVLRLYDVFRLSDCEGIAPKQTLTPKEELIEASWLISTWPQMPVLLHRDLNAAYYSPHRDEINMPNIDQFATSEAYASTLFHECVHATGHKSRLDRNLDTSFGSDDYAKEELIAEIGAAMLCAQTGTDQPLAASASYIQSWIQRLDNDHNLILSASAAAQKAADYISGKQRDIKLAA